jgi:hypothetical protein
MSFAPQHSHATSCTQLATTIASTCDCHEQTQLHLSTPQLRPTDFKPSHSNASCHRVIGHILSLYLPVVPSFSSIILSSLSFAGLELVPVPSPRLWRPALELFRDDLCSVRPCSPAVKLALRSRIMRDVFQTPLLNLD